MSWKNKFEWSKLTRDQVKSGMKAKLIVEKPWTEDAWVIGRLNKVFIVANFTDEAVDRCVSVNVPDFINAEDEDNSHICSDDCDNFVYQE